MRYTILILLLLLSSCYSQKRASRQMDRVKSEYEIIAASRCASWYPIKSDSVLIADTLYIESPNIDYTNTIDSLYAVVMRQIKPLPPNDTCASKVAPYVQQIKDLQGIIINFKNSYKAPDTVFAYINRNTTVTKENTANVRAKELQANDCESRITKYKVWAWVATGICLGLIVMLYFTMKNKRNANT